MELISAIVFQALDDGGKVLDAFLLFHPTCEDDVGLGLVEVGIESFWGLAATPLYIIGGMACGLAWGAGRYSSL